MKKFLGTRAVDLTIGQTLFYGFIVGLICWIPSLVFLYGGRVVDWFKGLFGKKTKKGEL